MVRRKNDQPAICQECNANFEGSGVNRYKNLRRHMETQHLQTIERRVLNHLHHMSNCNIDINQSITVIIGNIEMLEGLEVKHAIVEYILGEIRAGRKLTMMDIFKRIHMNPKYPENQNVVIPNVSKNEILYKTGDSVKVSEINKGVQVAHDAFIHRNIPEILDAMDDGPEKDAFKGNIHEKVSSTVNMGTKVLTKQLKMADASERKIVTKRMKDELNDY